MFKRVQTKQAAKMRLDLSVLEEVRRELETSQDISARPILTKIRNLGKKKLDALKLLCACDGLATFAQIWTIEYIFRDNNTWTERDLLDELKYFSDEGIISINENTNTIKFNGDDFDKIYTKYFARESRVLLNFEVYSIEIYWFIRMQSFLREYRGLRLISELMYHDLDMNLADMAGKLFDQSYESDIFAESPPVIRTLYQLMVYYRNRETAPMIQLQLNLPWINVRSAYYIENPEDVELLDKSLSKLKALEKRASDMQGSFLAEKIQINVAPVEVIAQKVERSANERFKKSLATQHALMMAQSYLKDPFGEDAKLHADLAFRYDRKPSSPMSNNLGYAFISYNELDKARSLLEHEINMHDSNFNIALAEYNLSVIEIKEGKIIRALELINSAIEGLSSTPENERICDCLFVPRVESERIIFEEVKDKIDLLDIAIEAKKVIEGHLEIL